MAARNAFDAPFEIGIYVAVGPRTASPSAVHRRVAFNCDRIGIDHPFT
jgi:hypothetical protein